MESYCDSEGHVGHQFTELLIDGCRVNIPDEIESRRDDLEREIGETQEQIKAKGGAVSGLIGLQKHRKIEKVSKKCEQLRYKYLKEVFTPHGNKNTKRKYINQISDYLQRKLKVKFSLRTRSGRVRALGDVLAYLVCSDELDLNEHLMKIIYRLSYPLYDHIEKNYPRCEVFWRMMSCNEEGFEQCFQQLSINETNLEYLLYKKPQLLFNTDSYSLLKALVEHLPSDNLRRILNNIRTANGQTLFFSIDSLDGMMIIARLYKRCVADLYELLSIKDTKGRTALHANRCVAKLLADTYTPRHQAALIELTLIRDKNYRIPQSSPHLSSLTRRVEQNRYVTDTSDMNVLIIYNTKTRPGARQEAQTIYCACRAKYERDNITMKKNLLKDEIIATIKQISCESTSTGPPKSLIVILASHGSNGRIHDCDGTPIELSVIEDAMCSDFLEERPKILITQCCQTEEDPSKETPPYVPQHDDFCALMSCRAGQASEREVFLKKLSEEIRNSKRDTDIFRVFNRVSRELRREGHKQTPIIMSTLKAEYCPTDQWAHGAAEQDLLAYRHF